MKTLTVPNENETAAFGRYLGQTIGPNSIIALTGELGTGKTTLTKYIAQGLGVQEHITSPTFVILKEYKSGRLPLYHFDAYRIDNPQELYQLGYEDYIFGRGVCVIEWADKISELIPATALSIQINYGAKEGERIYQCTF